jgi:excisionase family DNA binding protein
VSEQEAFKKHFLDDRKVLVVILILSAHGETIMIDFISPREAAKSLHISLNATYAAVWTGRLRAEKRDGKWLISGEAVEEYLRRRRSRETAKNALPESRDSFEVKLARSEQ